MEEDEPYVVKHDDPEMVFDDECFELTLFRISQLHTVHVAHELHSQTFETFFDSLPNVNAIPVVERGFHNSSNLVLLMLRSKMC